MYLLLVQHIMIQINHQQTIQQQLQYVYTIASQTQDLPNFTVKQEFVQLRYTFIQGKSGTFDGSLIVSATNNFIPKKNKNKDREQQSYKLVSFTHL